MQVAITGSGGLIGRALVTSLTDDGHDVLRMVRSRLYAADHPGAVYWNPAEGHLDPAPLAGVDAVVHLAGAGIGDRRWSDARKQEILRSRVDGTRLLALAAAGLDDPPRVLVSASAVGYYGDRGDAVLTEADPPGDGFLAEVTKAWEEATRPAADAGIRVVRARSGVVLDRTGGMLPKLLLPFRLGLGGRLGSGRQWMSWISLADEVRALRFVLDTADVSGPVNLTAPRPVTNREFVKALGQVLRRPTILPTPTLPLRLVKGGELVDEMLLAGQRVNPAVLERAGFDFEHPDIVTALRAVLDKR